MAAPGVSQMDPRIWQDAKVWNPARWHDEKGFAAAAMAQYSKAEQVDYGFGSVSKGTESPYQPFGAGRHRCVGEQFAYTQLSTIFTYVVRNFTLKLAVPKFPETNYRVSLRVPIYHWMDVLLISTRVDHDCPTQQPFGYFHPSKCRGQIGGVKCTHISKLDGASFSMN